MTPAALTPEHHLAAALVHGAGMDAATAARRLRVPRPALLELLAEVQAARAAADDADIAASRLRAGPPMVERDPRGSLPAVCRLSFPVRRAEDLVHLEGLSPAVAARLMKVPVGVVEDYLQQARVAREALAADRFRGAADPEPGMSNAQLPSRAGDPAELRLASTPAYSETLADFLQAFLKGYDDRNAPTGLRRHDLGRPA